MAVNQKTIYVYDDFSFDIPMLLGKLYVGAIKGGENFSFEYDSEWLKKTALPVDIDPELPAYGLSRGRIEAMRPAFSLCFD